MPELLRLARAAKKVGVSARWLRGEAAAGRIPCIRDGDRFVFELESLTKAIAERIRGDIARETVPCR